MEHNGSSREFSHGQCRSSAIAERKHSRPGRRKDHLRRTDHPRRERPSSLLQRLMYGYGAGAGTGGVGKSRAQGEGGGGGAGVRAIPVGVIEISDQQTRFIPITSRKKLAGAVLVGDRLRHVIVPPQTTLIRFVWHRHNCFRMADNPGVDGPAIYCAVCLCQMSTSRRGTFLFSAVVAVRVRAGDSRRAATSRVGSSGR